MVLVPSMLSENNHHDNDNNDTDKVLKNIAVDPQINERYGSDRGHNFNG